MKLVKAIPFICLCLFQPVVSASPSLWNEISTAYKEADTGARIKYQRYRADTQALTRLLSRADMEGRAKPSSRIELPTINGKLEQFSVQESPVMASGLAAKYHEVKTYKVNGIDNPAYSGRLSITSKGFHAMITGPSGTYYIDPQSTDTYKAYRKSDQQPAQPFNCGVKGHTHEHPLGNTSSRPAYRSAGGLRVYRLALAATEEYITAVGGTDLKAHEEIIVAINRVNEIYQRDLGIKLELIDDNDKLLETRNLLTVGYDNLHEYNMLLQNQQNLDDVIGSENYDIGHVFGTGGGGIATVGSVCGDYKAEGATGLYNPIGDPFYIDYVAHEMGHQFDAYHTFNGTENNCGGTARDGEVAYEPGSGSTIMSYAGICDAENISTHADALFHAGSVRDIDIFTTSGDGADCGSIQSINNPAEPVVDAGSNYSIPAKTSFLLTADGSDSDADPLVYTWDQMDAGTATNENTLGKDLGDNSLFRSYLPRAQNFRHFPALGTTLQNKYDNSESLPCNTRSVNFRVTVRDGHSGMSSDDVLLSAVSDSGPFKISSFATSTTLNPGEQIIRWDVATTNLAPINCSQVDISLLTFNSAKTTYSEHILADNVPNDGFALISIPDQSNANSRFKIQCSNNVFYDISDADLVINGAVAFATTHKPIFYNADGPENTFSNTPFETCQGSSNNTPVAQDDSFSVVQDGYISVDVLNNDTDADSDTLSITRVTQGQHGLVEINQNGTIKFTPTPKFTGLDSFYYTLSDGEGGFASAKISFTVTTPNTSIILQNDTLSLNEDSTKSIDVLENDRDDNGGTLTVASVSQGEHGKVSLSTGGMVTYTPDLNYFGTDSFTYTASDGGNNYNLATVVVTVLPINDKPLAENDSATVTEGESIDINVLLNDSDIEGAVLTVTSVTQGVNGVVEFNAVGVISYTPTLEFSGTDSFTYIAFDGDTNSNVATVMVTVNPKPSGTPSSPVASSGGGAINLWFLFSLLLLNMYYRKEKY